MEAHMANGQADPADQEAPRASDEWAHAAKDEARAIKEQASGAAAEIKAEARHAAEQVKEQVRSGAAKQKDVAVQQMEGWAHALRSASDDLQDRGQDTAASWVRQAAASLERASGGMRERGVDDLIGTVEDFARRQPVAFLGGAVVAGFGLARLMKSSADRRRTAAAGSGVGESAPAGMRGGEGDGL
jgi:hypothetical protein